MAKVTLWNIPSHRIRSLHFVSQVSQWGKKNHHKLLPLWILRTSYVRCSSHTDCVEMVRTKSCLIPLLGIPLQRPGHIAGHFKGSSLKKKKKKSHPVCVLVTPVQEFHTQTAWRTIKENKKLALISILISKCRCSCYTTEAVATDSVHFSL